MFGLSLLLTHRNQTQMVIQMARTYIQTTWNNSDKFGYSGVQQHFTKNGGANTKAYADPEPVKKIKKVREPDFRLTSEKTIDRLEKHRADLDAAFESGKLTFDRYEVLLNEWEAKMERAWTRHDKATGAIEESKEVESKPSHSILPSIERAASTFASRHPFATLVGVIVLGSMILNLFGFGA